MRFAVIIKNVNLKLSNDENTPTRNTLHYFYHLFVFQFTETSEISGEYKYPVSGRIAVNKDLKIYDAIARRRVIKAKQIFIEDSNYKQFVDPVEEYSQVRSHAHYNVKLSIITSLEQRQ